MDYGPEEEGDYSQQRKKKGDILREGVWSLREESERDFGKSFREFSLERGISLKLR